MPWLELQLTLDAADQPRAEAALEDLDALSVTLMDADADTPDEAAIFEPGVGETPLWHSLTLLALFEADRDRRGIVHGLQDALPGLAPERIAFREIADQDWERAWMDRYQPMRFGRRLWIYPWNIEPPGKDAPHPGTARSALRATDLPIVVRLDPGLAFGTGTHPTTALCLEWLDGLGLEAKTVMDYGCGSGVLAIAALKLGAARAIGIDNDPQALIATRDNAARNHVADRLRACLPEEFPGNGCAEVFVANILAGPLAELAPRFASLCKPGAPFALSGILAGQEIELLDRYRDCGFTRLHATRREDWMRIDGVRG
ncbi:MAG TPA: 50S ribosomal protein L11 methyltransferase [Rhodanobacteraceae bacterium]|nr:50S ribosomal protein L11 methyltransferase [Rhodanobacteraceae bacterium]